MAGEVRGDSAGGIQGLYGLIRQHREAIRYDLFISGRTLDGLGVDYSWDDFAAFVRYSPPTSQLWQAVHGDAPWSRAEMLLAMQVDATRGGNWQRGGGKGAKPIPVAPAKKKAPQYGKPQPIDEVAAYLQARNGRAPEMRS